MSRKARRTGLPNRIRFWREERGLTLEEMAARCGFTLAHLSKIELGQRELTHGRMERIARELGVSPADLLNLEDGGLSDKERRIIATYREIPEAMRASIEAVAESQQAFRGAPEVVPLGDDQPSEPEDKNGNGKPARRRA